MKGDTDMMFDREYSRVSYIVDGIEYGTSYINNKDVDDIKVTAINWQRPVSQDQLDKYPVIAI